MTAIDRTAIFAWFADNVGPFSDRLAGVYRLLDWHWCDEPHTPTATEIAANLHRMLVDVVAQFDEDQTRTFGSLSTGGLYVGITKMRDEIDEALDRTRFEVCIDFSHNLITEIEVPS